MLLAIAGIAGCNQSLFDAHSKPRDGGPPGDDAGGDGGTDGPVVPASCPDTCVADAAEDFGGSSTPWRYLEEAPNHTWPEMMIDGSKRAGMLDPLNQFQLCSQNSSVPACQVLNGALLVSSAGNANPFFPALELKPAGAPRVLHLIVRAYASGQSAAHNIRLYRNGREDILFTQLAMPGGEPVEKEVVVDALPDDRFLVVIEPTDTRGGTVALDVFVSDQGENFPSTCQFAASFSAASNDVVEDLCGPRNLTAKKEPTAPQLPMIINIDGPFIEQGPFVDLPSGSYLEASGNPLVRAGGPLTVQFWLLLKDAPLAGQPYSYAFTDYSGDDDSGSAIGFFKAGNVFLQLEAASTGSPSSIIFPLNQWRFVRLVEKPGMLELCIDGVRVLNPTAVTGSQATQSFVLGKHTAFQTFGAFFQGSLDDVRVFNQALPCN